MLVLGEDMSRADLTLPNMLILSAGAIGISFVSATTGISEDSLLVPFMVLTLNYDVKTAITTSLITCYSGPIISHQYIILGRG